MKRIGMICLAMLILCIGNQADLYAEAEGGFTNMFDNLDIRKCAPRNYNPELAAQKGLGDGDGYSDEYFRLQARYAEVLWQMIEAECGITALDQQLESSDMRFLPEPQPKNVYQKHWCFHNKYLFLRNNLCIERLNEQDIDALRNIDAEAVDKAESMEIVRRTLRKVICVYPQLDDDTKVLYDRRGVLIPNYAIVIGLITRPDYDENGNFVSAQAERDKRLALEAFIEKTQAQMTEAMGIQTVILNQ